MSPPPSPSTFVTRRDVPTLKMRDPHKQSERIRTPESSDIESWKPVPKKRWAYPPQFSEWYWFSRTEEGNGLWVYQARLMRILVLRSLCGGKPDSFVYEILNVSYTIICLGWLPLLIVSNTTFPTSMVSDRFPDRFPHIMEVILNVCIQMNTNYLDITRAIRQKIKVCARPHWL